MSHPAPEPPPLHPVRESAGFLRAILSAVMRMLWPTRHRQRPGGPLVVDQEAAPVSLDIAEKISAIAPYPVDD